MPDPEIPIMWNTTSSDTIGEYTFRHSPLIWGASLFGQERPRPTPTILGGALGWSVHKEGGVGYYHITLHTPNTMDSVLYCADIIYYLSSSLWDQAERLGEDYV